LRSLWRMGLSRELISVDNHPSSGHSVLMGRVTERKYRLKARGIDVGRIVERAEA